MATEKKLRFDSFVKELNPDDRPIFVTGYVGTSERKNCVRVYNDASLNNYVEFAESDVLHAIANTARENQLGGSKIWLKKDAKLVFGDNFMETKTADQFTDGDVMNYYRASMFSGTNSINRIMAISPGATPDLERRRTVTIQVSRRNIC